MTLTKWRSWFSCTALALMLTACGGGDGGGRFGGGGGGGSATPSEVPNEVMRASFTASGGSVFSVPSGASGLGGATIDIPADAALDDVEVHVGYETNQPGPFRPEAVAAGATPVSKTVVLKVASSLSDLKSLNFFSF